MATCRGPTCVGAELVVAIGAMLADVAAFDAADRQPDGYVSCLAFSTATTALWHAAVFEHEAAWFVAGCARPCGACCARWSNQAAHT